MLLQKPIQPRACGASENFPEKFLAKANAMYIARAKVCRKVVGIEEISLILFV